MENKKRGKKKKEDTPVINTTSTPQHVKTETLVEKRSLLPKDLYSEIQSLKKRVSELEAKLNVSLETNKK